MLYRFKRPKRGYRGKYVAGARSVHKQTWTQCTDKTRDANTPDRVPINLLKFLKSEKNG